MELTASVEAHNFGSAQEVILDLTETTHHHCNLRPAKLRSETHNHTIFICNHLRATMAASASKGLAWLLWTGLLCICFGASDAAHNQQRMQQGEFVSNQLSLTLAGDLQSLQTCISLLMSELCNIYITSCTAHR